MDGNFSYISYGSASQQLEDEVVLGRGRMFEYTPVDLSKRLEDLGPESVSFLEDLPTFLCSEISRSDDASMIVRFGNVARTQVDGKRVVTNFVPVIEFGRIVFGDENTATSVFGADRWQLHRTHWAVRSGDVEAVLHRLAELSPERRTDVAAFAAGAQPAATVEPPVRKRNVVGTADSVDGFLRLLYGRSDRTETEIFFRGHVDPSFELTPSLLRKWPDGTWKHLPNEHRLCKELLIAHDDEFVGDRYCFDRLVRMQHYGLPTRLLDISGNPLVALFFACYGAVMPPEASGEVIVFRVRRDSVRYYDSDTVSCLSNLSNLTFEQKNGIDLQTEVTEFNQQLAVGKLLHHVRSEKGYFEARILPADIGSVVCVKAKRTNTRIRSQDGAFLLFGHDAILPEGGFDGIEIERISVTDKASILSQLASIGIGATTVYPSIDQTAVHLRELLQRPPSS